MSKHRKNSAESASRDADRGHSGQSRWRFFASPWLWAILAMAGPLLLCAGKVSLDLWEDEIYTLEYFVSKPDLEIVSRYVPNNHMGYSLYLRRFFTISEAPTFLRLSSLPLVAIMLAAMFRLGYRLGGTLAGALATFALGLNVMVLVHAMQLRGYGLSMCLVTVLAALAAIDPAPSGRERPRILVLARAIAIAVLSAWFLLVLPTNALFLAPLAILSIARRAWRRPISSLANEAIAWGAGVGIATVVYYPLWDDLRAAGAGQAPANWAYVWATFRSVFAAAARDLWPLSPLIMAGWISLLWGWRGKRAKPASSLTAKAEKSANSPSVSACEASPSVGEARWAFGSLVVMLVVPFCLARFLPGGIFNRNYLPVVPFLSLGVAWPLAELARLARSFFPTKSDSIVRKSAVPTSVAAVVVLLAALAPAVALYPKRLREAGAISRAQDGYFNYYASDYSPSRAVAALAERVEKGEDYKLVHAVEDFWNLRYYLGRQKIANTRVSAPGKSQVEIYVIAPDRADESLSGEGFSELRATLANVDIHLAKGDRLAIVGDFGYYRLFRSERRAKNQADETAPP